MASKNHKLRETAGSSDLERLKRAGQEFEEALIDSLVKNHTIVRKFEVRIKRGRLENVLVESRQEFIDGTQQTSSSSR